MTQTRKAMLGIAPSRTSGVMGRAAMIIGLLLGGSLAKAEGPDPPHWVPDLLTDEEASAGFYPLFNGKDLDGWRVRGPNKSAFAVEAGGVLRVLGVPDDDWLLTDHAYENFLLRLEYRLPSPKGHSGIGVRATAEGDPTFTGLEVQVLEPTEPPTTATSGALFASVAPSASADKAVGGWNEVEILCDGPRVRTRMNGKTLYDVRTTDETSRADGHPPLVERAKRGFVALQNAGDPVEYRRIRIMPLPGGEGMRPLFNGKDLSGWGVLGEARWDVLADGVLRVSGVEDMGRSELRTLEESDDFELSLWVRPHAKPDGGGSNSGVFFRGAGERPWPLTYEVQVDNHAPEQFTGSIWDQVRASELRAMDDCWCHLFIRADGPMIQVHVNGKVVVDYVSSKHPTCPRGWLSLQGHDASSVVDFRDIEIRPIPRH